MSATASSGNKANLFSEENEALYDPYPWFNINSSCEQIPWPEWNDAELNSEVWDEGKVGRTGTAAPSFAVFNDSDPPRLTSSISDYVCSWKRPQEVFPNAPLTVYDPSNVDFELKVPSSLLPINSFFKFFNELLPILQFYAFQYGFSVELETPNFVATTQGDCWRPWHHIYALCKSGKGQVHKPQYCPYGKYVVRLYYMGAWRRFVVDDKIPCDIEGNCILPTTQILGELWPIILTKALLKIISLIPAENYSVIDFPLLTAFTGWVQAFFNVLNKTVDQIWRRLVVLAPSYKRPEVEENPTSLKNQAVRIESSKKESERLCDKKETFVEQFCFLLCDLKSVSLEENVEDDLKVVLTMTRDTPLVKAVKKEGTKPWKRFRWIYWAKEKGLWIDENQIPPYRRVLTITFCEKLWELLMPDPRLEAAMFSFESEDELEEEFSDEKSRELDREIWFDYLKLLNYLTRVNVFFRPSYFHFNFKVTCVKPKIIENASGGKNISKAPISQNIFFYPYLLKETCNEPIYLICESTSNIFLCISLWVCPQSSKNIEGYLETDQPDFLKVGRASLIVENFSWSTLEQGEIIGLAKTVGNAVIVVNMKPGRQTLKLWLNSDSPYTIDLYSNSNILIEKSPKLHYLMNNESHRIVNYINNVSNAFMALTLKFGKPDLASALRDFYNTIKPGHDGAPDYYKKLDDFIEAFINCILLTLKDLVSNLDDVKIMMWALRSLFINPNIYCNLPPGAPIILGGGSKKPGKKIPGGVLKERTLSEILNYTWLPEEIKKIITIQRIFRGFRVRLLWKYQTSSRKEFKPFTERLKKICDTVFIPAKRELEVGKLLRKIIIKKPELLNTFKFHSDFLNVIEVEEFSGKIPNVETFAWVPIARFIIACHSDDLVPCAFYLSCNLKRYVVQCFNNDTGKELFRVANSVSPHNYQRNNKGYTIFIFGWNESNSKTVNWRLEMVKMKHFQVLHLCNALTDSICYPYAMPNIEVADIKNFYIPNSKSRICKCLIKVQKRTLLTLKFTTSYSDVHFCIIIYLDKKYSEYCSESDDGSRVITSLSSCGGSVIVPTVVLEYIESSWWEESNSDSNYTLYILEAYVINNSWPLTKQEWGLVEPIRINGESIKSSNMSLQNKRVNESRKKLSRASKKNTGEQKLENPYWLLQVLNDSGVHEFSDPIVEEDKSSVEAVKSMKLSWEEKDPGRRLRGSEIRMQFLHEIYLEQRNNQSLYCEDYFDEVEEKYDDPQTVVDKLSSLSYLLNDPSLTRYTYSPRILPSTPLCELFLKYKKPPDDFRESLEESELEQSQTSSDFNYTETSVSVAEQLENDKKNFLKQCVHYRSVMASHLNQEQLISMQLMEEAYERRSKAIERILR